MSPAEQKLCPDERAKREDWLRIPCAHRQIRRLVYDYCAICGAVRRPPQVGDTGQSSDYEWHTCVLCRLPPPYDSEEGTP